MTEVFHLQPTYGRGFSSDRLAASTNQASDEEMKFRNHYRDNRCGQSGLTQGGSREVNLVIYVWNIVLNVINLKDVILHTIPAQVRGMLERKR